MQTEKILFVDDEPAALEGYGRILRKHFNITCANSGETGLEAIRTKGPFAVVVSDMRMPQMNGAEFLSRVKTVSPETVRVLLTGFADTESAIAAVNDGNIFRFLTKPCAQEVLAKSLNAALEQYRLITAEKELLEKTLLGSVKVLAEVLSMVNPVAFGRSMRVKRYVQHIVAKRNLPGEWRFEVAALLSQLGCVTVDPLTLDKAYTGLELSAEEKERYNAHPKAARELLACIPRMEQIGWMIEHQNSRLRGNDPEVQDCEFDALIGARMLKLCLAYDHLMCKGYSHADAIRELHTLAVGPGEKALLACLNDLPHEANPSRVVSCRIRDLRSGMILDQHLMAEGGVLLVSKGQEVTQPLILILTKYLERGAISDSVLVRFQS